MPAWGEQVGVRGDTAPQLWGSDEERLASSEIRPEAVGLSSAASGDLAVRALLPTGTDGSPPWLRTAETPSLEPVQDSDESRWAGRSSLLNAARWQLAVKRLMDVIGAIVGLVILSPLYLGITLAILLTSGRPVFYEHIRVGRDGKPFRFIKFRTMTRNAEQERHLVIDLNEADGPVFKIRNDPRVTPLGRVLRRYSLDELPQLLHVLTGEMSLVGPRPPLPDEVKLYSDRELQRLTVKPGLTCSWQVSGRSDVEFRAWVDLDVEYIQNWNLRSDIKLILKTIPAVFTGRGAY